MKEQAAKKGKKWIPVVAILAVLAAAAVLLAVFLRPAQPQEQPAGETTAASALYWNLDRKYYAENTEVEGMSGRTRGEDGFTTFRMVSGGKVLEVKTADRQLANYMDTMDVMGLVFDDGGLVIDALVPEQISKVLIKEVYVTKVVGRTIYANSSIALNGMTFEVEVPEHIPFSDVRPDTKTPGPIDTMVIMDQVSVYTDMNDQITDVFLIKRQPEAGVYIRANRFYDSSTGATSRKPDENGVYTAPFAHNGEIVQLKCKDKYLLGELEKGTEENSVFGLLFDEEGYISGYVSAAFALRGKMIAHDYTITAIEGDLYTATCKFNTWTESGRTVQFRITEETEIYSMDDQCIYTQFGQKVEKLEIGERIHCYTDPENNARMVLLSKHTVDAPMYYNITMRHNADLTASTREKDKNGYYVYDMVGEGKRVTLKTKDKAIADKIDTEGRQVMGLKIENGIILEYYNGTCVCGYQYLGTGRFVADVMGAIIRLASSTDLANGSNYTINSESKVYDITGDYGTKMGQVTTLQVGDRIIGNRNPEGDLTHSFVNIRYHEGTKIYYNINQRYSPEKDATTRVPDEDGWYYHEVVYNGKETLVKHKSKALATFIDKQGTGLVALKVNSSGVVKEAYQAASAFLYGTRACSSHYVEKVNKDGTFQTYTLSNGEKKSVATVWKMAENCKVYNMSSAYKKSMGETTKLQKGDKIQAFQTAEKGEIVAIYVMSRTVDSPLYWPVSRQYNSTTGETTRQPDADGYYTVDLLANGKIVTLKTKDKAAMSSVDANTNAFGILSDGGLILRAVPFTSVGEARYGRGDNFDVVSIKGNKITLQRNRPGSTNLGATDSFTVGKNCKVYDISPYAEVFGQETKLRVGDRIKCYLNGQQEMIYCYITYKCTRENPVSYCPHCEKEVWWEPYYEDLSPNDYEADCHLYLVNDMNVRQRNTGFADPQKPKYDVVLDLNGHTATSETRNFLVYGKLSIVDSVGTGKLVGCYNGNGGTIMVTEGGILNVYGGTLTAAEGAQSVSGGVLYADGGSTINLYGGTITGGKVTGNGGNITVRKATLNMYGGTVSGGSAEKTGGNIQVGTDAAANLLSGTITGGTAASGGNINIVSQKEIPLTLAGTEITEGITVSAPAVVVLEGTQTLSGLDLASGAKLDITKLNTDSQISISAGGVFTTEREDITTVAGCFQPAISGCTIAPEGKTLACKVEIPAFTADLTFTGDSKLAVCAACQRVVTWTPVTEASRKLELQPGGHYYLENDITYTGEGACIVAADGSACLHLNGHNITVTSDARAIQATANLNVMGSGIVTGSLSADYKGSAVEVASTDALVNLYSGTYKSTGKYAVVCVTGNGGTLNIHGDVTVDATGTNTRGVVSFWGMVNILGGRILGGGNHAVLADNWTSAKSGTINISGGEIVAGTASALRSGSAATAPATLNISGGTITGQVYMNNHGVGTLSGSPVITLLDGQNAALWTLGELTSSASITVQAEGIFTNACDQAAQYAGYFHPAEGYKAIAVKENALWTEPKPAPVSNAPLVLTGNQAKCEVCQKTVTWTAITDGAAKQTLADGHYYLAKDITYTGADATFLETTGNVCLHLNEHHITVTANARAILGGGTLHVLGNGTVTGNLSTNYKGSAVESAGSEAVVDLYGGTYKTTGKHAILCVTGNGGTLNIYDGVTVDASGTNARAISAFWGTVNILGGRIQGGSNCTVMADNWTSVKSGTVNISGGQILAGTSDAIRSGSAATAPAMLHISGGTITGNIYMNKSGYGLLSGNPVITQLDGNSLTLWTLGELTEGASITVRADGIFTNASEKAAQYLQYFHAAEGYKPVTEENSCLKSGKE